MLGQPIPSFGLPRPISFIGLPWPISLFFHFHGFLLNSLGFLGPITTSLPFGLIGLYANPMDILIPFLGFLGHLLLFFYLLLFPLVYYLHSLGFLNPFASSCPLIIFCGPVDHYSCHSGLLVFALLLSLLIFFIFFGFFFH